MKHTLCLMLTYLNELAWGFFNIFTLFKIIFWHVLHSQNYLHKFRHYIRFVSLYWLQYVLAVLKSNIIKLIHLPISWVGSRYFHILFQTGRLFIININMGIAKRWKRNVRRRYLAIPFKQILLRLNVDWL